MRTTQKHSRRYSRLIIPALFASAVLWTWGSPTAQQKQVTGDKPIVQLVPTARPEPLVRRGPAPDVEILFASEVKGYYQPCG